MTRTMRLSVTLSVLAGIASIAGATSLMAQHGPGKGYSSIPAGAYSVVAEVKAKPARKPSCGPPRCHW